MRKDRLEKSGSAMLGSIIDNQSRHRRKLSDQDLPDGMELDQESEHKSNQEQMEFRESSSEDN